MDEQLGKRARQAKQTHDAILAAARRLFAERGYARTTVRDVAAAAGVSAQTVYDSVGSKQDLVARLNDLIDDEAGIVDLVGPAVAGDDPAALISLPARITRSIVEHCGDIVHALHERGALAADLDLEEVADGVAAVSEVRVVLMLRSETYGWSPDRIEGWITDLIRAQLSPAG